MKAWFAMLTIVIVVSVSVAAAAVTSKDALTANGQVLNPYGVSSSTGADPTKLVWGVVLTPTGVQVHSVTGTTAPMCVGSYCVFGSDGVYFVHDLVNGVWNVQFSVTNHLSVAATVTPRAQLYATELFRNGITAPLNYAGAQGCPARPSVNPESWLTPALSSAANGTHDSTAVTMSFQVSTLNINSSKATNNEPLVATSVVDTFLKLHPAAATVSPAANQVQLQQSLCTVTTQIGTVYGKTTTLQPGQTATIESTVNSTNWGFACSPVANALINYNVQAGSSTYQALKTGELIVFSPEESNICGS
jgi:hypothetical protein